MQFPRVYSYGEFDVNSLGIDELYQRDLYSSFSDSLADDIDPIAFQNVTVAKRSDGSLWVVDGQQRLFAAMKAGYTSVPCAVFISNGSDHEAEIYKKINADKKPMKPFDIWKAKLIYKDPAALNINLINRMYGVEIVGPGCVNKWYHSYAVTALENAYKLGHHRYNDIIRVLHTAFNGQEKTFCEPMITGLTMLFREYDNLIDVNDLINKLRTKPVYKIAMDAGAAQAKNGGAGGGGGRATYYCNEFRMLYNKNRRSGRLER